MAKRLRAKRQEEAGSCLKLPYKCLTFDISEENFLGFQGDGIPLMYALPYPPPSPLTNNHFYKCH